MKKTFYSLLVMALGLTACDKDDVKKDPPVITTMTRELDFTVTGAEKDTVYTTASKIITEAGFSSFTSSAEKNTFFVAFHAGPHVDNAAGDFILFKVDRSKLKEGIAGTYSLHAQANPLKDIRYVYTVRNATGGITSSINEATMHSGMQGSLIIEKYDALNRTISGSYEMTVALQDDPTTFNIGHNPEEQCTLRVAGTFTNVKFIQD